MNILISAAALLILILLVIVGIEAAGLEYFFGVFIPYMAVVIFLSGIIFKLIGWARSPVPFRIPTIAGQQKSLGWIKSSKLDSPATILGVVGRMVLEVLLFRSLFRNTKYETKPGQKLVYGSAKFLWIAALIFHWSFLIIILRHLRYISEPIPSLVPLLQNLDGFFQVGVPELFITNILIVVSLAFLFMRRTADPKNRYLSLTADYFPLLLILAIAITGIMMRYFTKVDIAGIKTFAMGLVSFKPVVPESINVIFYIHLFLVSSLLVYFSFSKLLHMVGVFLSPTRNLSNNNRSVRHVNPWDKPVRIHTYEEYEDEFRDKMKAAGLPLEKE